MASIDRDIFTRYIFAKLAEAPTLARTYTEIAGKRLKYRRAYYRIKKYVDDFFEGNVEKRLIVLPGLRGVGKTTILFQIYNYLWGQKSVEQDRILYFSTDELKTYLGGRMKDNRRY